jgi:hypothetical protein
VVEMDESNIIAYLLELRQIIRLMRKPYKLKASNKNDFGIKEGFCIQEWPCGTVLKGIFRNNKVNGLARIKTSDGKTFEGKALITF